MIFQRRCFAPTIVGVLLSLRRVICDDIGKAQNPNWSVSPYSWLLNQVEDSRLESFTPCWIPILIYMFLGSLPLVTKPQSLSRTHMKFIHPWSLLRQDPATSLRRRRDHPCSCFALSKHGDFASKNTIFASRGFNIRIALKNPQGAPHLGKLLSY